MEEDGQRRSAAARERLGSSGELRECVRKLLAKGIGEWGAVGWELLEDGNNGGRSVSERAEQMNGREGGKWRGRDARVLALGRE